MLKHIPMPAYPRYDERKNYDKELPEGDLLLQLQTKVPVYREINEDQVELFWLPVITMSNHRLQKAAETEFQVHVIDKFEEQTMIHHMKQCALPMRFFKIPKHDTLWSLGNNPMYKSLEFRGVVPKKELSLYYLEERIPVFKTFKDEEQ